MKRAGVRAAIFVACFTTFLLTGCALNAGSNAEAEFAGFAHSTSGEWCESVESFGSNDLPGQGTLRGRVTLRPDTPPAELARIREALRGFAPPPGVHYEFSGITANGIASCEPLADDLLALRQQLFTDEAALSGQWGCMEATQDEPSYRGTFLDFAADRALLASLSDTAALAALPLRGVVSGPGESTGLLSTSWPEVPAAIDDLLPVAAGSVAKMRWSLQEDSIEFAVADDVQLGQMNEALAAFDPVDGVRLFATVLP